MRSVILRPSDCGGRRQPAIIRFSICMRWADNLGTRRRDADRNQAKDYSEAHD